MQCKHVGSQWNDPCQVLRLVTSANTRDSVHPTDQLGTSCNRRALAATEEEDFGISAQYLGAREVIMDDDFPC